MDRRIPAPLICGYGGRWLFAVLGSLLAISLCFAGDDELLAPEEAFPVEAVATEHGMVRLTWQIANGYYLYRDKIRARSLTDGVHLGDPELPDGKIKHDEFFGAVETYRGTLAVEVPVRGASGQNRRLVVEATSQGCADLGVCYPPFVQVATVELPPEARDTTATDAEAAPRAQRQQMARLGELLGISSAEREVLAPEEAFQLIAEVTAEGTLIAAWRIADGHYLYRDKFALALQDAQGDAAPGLELGTVQMPPGELKEDEFFGQTEVYYHEAVLRAPLQRTAAAPDSFTLEARYQGCAEIGICYPPITSHAKLEWPATPAAAAITNQTGASDAVPRQAFISEQDRLAQRLASGKAWLTIGSFFGFGLLLAFTPCVFPMIPILSSIIVGQGRQITTARAFGLSLAYVLAMALTYTLTGVLAGLFGGNLQATFQNPYLIAAFASVFVLLALSMFGFYELQLPRALQTRLAALSNRQQSGSYLGVAAMGLLSALIVGPCVAPPLAGALIYIGNTGDPWLGGTALFALSLGMGIPLLAIGTSAGKLLPRSGSWMNTVKAVFGVLLLAVAVWMLERILPGEVTLILWALLLIVPAIYMGALEPVKIEATGWTKLWKGIGLVMLVYGIVLIVGAASGSRDVFRPLQLLATSGGTAAAVAANRHGLPFKPVKTVDDVTREVRMASARNRSVMLDVYADWCISCKEMERFTFSSEPVQRALANTTLLQADVTANDADDKALLKHFGLYGPPSILFYGADGVERKPYRLVGFLDAEAFRDHVERALH